MSVEEAHKGLNLSPSHRRVLVLLMAAVVAVAAGAEEFFSMELHTHIALLDRAEPPRLIAGRLVFSYEDDSPVRYVAARFEHEDYAVRHVFQRNEEDVFFLVYTPPDNVDSIRYRLVVDGLSMLDPNNPEFTRAPNDLRVSVMELPAQRRPQQFGPRPVGDGRVEFTFRGAIGRRVFLTGTFANWDPYLYRMNEIEPGTYRIELPLRAGTHYYHYVVDGRRLPDPTSPLPRYEQGGREVSRFDHAPVQVRSSAR